MTVMDYVKKRVIVDEVTGCWNWQKAKSRAGYGIFRYKDMARLAHRAVYAETHGRDVMELDCICHQCDNPPCVNPSHLFEGTVGDNNADKTAKHRVPHGTGHWKARLCDDDAREIRQRIRTGENQTAIANLFGVSRSVIAEIGQHLAWSRA